MRQTEMLTLNNIHQEVEWIYNSIEMDTLTENSGSDNERSLE